MELRIRITAHFRHKETGEPFTGHEYKVRLYDKDFFQDDFLGETELYKDGSMEIIFDPQHISSLDSPLEEQPDLYCVLLRGETVIFKTQVLEDLDLQNVGTFDPKQGLHYDLGTFLVN
jgi:hypothetical protein